MSRQSEIPVAADAQAASYQNCSTCMAMSNRPCRLRSLAHRDDHRGLRDLLDKYVWQRFAINYTGYQTNASGLDSIDIEIDEPWEILSREDTQRLKLKNPQVSRHPIWPANESDAYEEMKPWEILYKDQPEDEEINPKNNPKNIDSTGYRPHASGTGKWGLKRNFLPAWFINSAVFCGCPALLRHLLPSKQHDVRTVEGSVFPDDLSDPNTLYIANARVACEFPVTDTWINRGTLLIMAPLHFACWRHDLAAIKRLLEHGADPNALALESVDRMKAACYFHWEEADKIPQGMGGRPYFKHCGQLFYKRRGLSPLHFLGFGLRCAPKHSLLEGSKAGIIHDICSAFRSMSSCEDAADSDCLQNDMCTILGPLWHTNLSEEDIATRSELLVKCIEALLEAGANPNAGRSSIFQGVYPLDIFLQPPIDVYYSPSFARADMEAVTLRWRDLEYLFHSVLSACSVLVNSGGKVSATFVMRHKWRPAFLDSFRIRDPEKTLQLVKYLLFFGVFSGPEGHRGNLSEAAEDMEDVFERFIADIFNMSVPEIITTEILRWCPVRFHYNIIKAMDKTKEKFTRVGESSDFTRMSNLVRSTLQFRSLKHHSALVILESLRFSHPAIDALPLPPRLKRELKALECF